MQRSKEEMLAMIPGLPRADRITFIRVGADYWQERGGDAVSVIGGSVSAKGTVYWDCPLLSADMTAARRANGEPT